MQIIKTARRFVFKPIELDIDIELDIETDANDIKRGVGDITETRTFFAISSGLLCTKYINRSGKIAQKSIW